MKNLKRSHRYFLSILSGVLMVISFPYTGSLTPLVFVAWVPLLIVEHSITVAKYRSRKIFLHSYLTFFIYNLGTTWWIWNADESGAAMAFIFNSLLMAIAFQLFHFCKKHIGRKEGYIGFLLIWIGFEYLHFQWELSYPWLTLGNVFSIHPSWVQWYSYTGVLGGSLWILSANLLFFRLVENRFLKKEKWNIQTPYFILIGLMLFIPLSSSLFTYYNYTDQGKKVEVVISQPNIDPYNDKFGGLDPKLQLKRMADEVDKKITPNTSFVLAPETAIPYNIDEAIFKETTPYAYLQSRLKNWGDAVLLIGSSTMKTFDKKRSRASKKIQSGPGFLEYYNTSVLMDTSGNLGFIHKSKLVLGVEFIPFSHWFPTIEDLSIDLGGSTGSLGKEKEPMIFAGPDFAFAPSICYESIYGEFIGEQCKKGAEAIFIITNDGWWGDTPGYKQHASFARLRAIEHRRCVARSANTGISCFINQRGDVLQKTDWWVQTALKDRVAMNKTNTFYSVQGDGLGRVFAFTSLLLILLGIVRKIKPIQKIVKEKGEA